MKTSNAMIQNIVDKRSEFRFPVAVPVEYFNNDDYSIASYSLDLSRHGTFISSDNPYAIGNSLSMNLSIPVDSNISEILRTRGSVTWNRLQPFKSIKNGMGVRFLEPLREELLLNSLSSHVMRLVKDSEAKKLLEERVEKFESELKDAEKWAEIGHCTEKILFDISNPLTTLTGKLGLIKEKMHVHRLMLEENCGTNCSKLKGITDVFDDCYNDIIQIVNDYSSISRLIRIMGDEKKDLEDKLKEYNC